MKTRMFIFFLVSALALLFASCGEETSSAARNRNAGGTVLDRNAVGKIDRQVIYPVIKKKPLPPVNIQTWPMISTGQTRCYDYEKEIECPKDGEAYSGQDGQKRYGTRSLQLRESNKEVVEDSITRLLWTKQIKKDVTWYEAKAYCDSLRLDGKTWRLPTTAELRSIVNYGKVGPALDDVFYKNGLTEDTDLKDSLSNWFWASKHVNFNYENNNNLASSWIINFYDGFVEYTSRYNVYHARCVTEF